MNDLLTADNCVSKIDRLKLKGKFKTHQELILEFKKYQKNGDVDLFEKKLNSICESFKGIERLTPLAINSIDFNVVTLSILMKANYNRFIHWSKLNHCNLDSNFVR